MNGDVIDCSWKPMTGGVQSKWGAFTKGEVDQIAEDRERLVGLIQERYGVTKDEAEHQINSFIAEHKSAA